MVFVEAPPRVLRGDATSVFVAYGALEMECRLFRETLTESSDIVQRNIVSAFA